MKYLIVILISFCFVNTHSQEFKQYPKYLSPLDSMILVNIPELTLPEAYKGDGAKVLPDYLNNSTLPFFRPVFLQYGWSCGQASTIGYQFTYEINRVNNTSASLEENQFTPEFTFNFYNKGEDGVGVNYLHSFDIAKHVGNPSIMDYGGFGENLKKWVSGYDTYYNSMFNRVDEVYTIHVGNEEGLQTLKYWILDHLDGSTYGGIANFYTDLSSTTYLPYGTPEAGKSVITEFGPYQGHSMTFLGWNDSIRWDYNNDGQYTNDIDITGDGEVTMKDWEIGGVILANSWGDYWGDNGFCYVMYNVLAREKLDGGIWNKQVNVINVKNGYEPQITYKIKLKHTSRNKIKVLVGISSDVTSIMPDYTMDFPIFNYQGGDNYMQGENYNEEHKTIEFGLDATPLLSYIADGEPAKFFLQIHENDPLNVDAGVLKNFSLMDYSDGLVEITCPVIDTTLTNNGYTTISVIHAVNFDKVNIETEELPAYVDGEPYSFQLTAIGGTEPYTWDIDPMYTEIQEEGVYPDIQGEHLIPTSNQYGFAKKNLDFSFPFYGANYDSVYVHVDGFLMFDETPVPLPYQSDDLFLFKNIKMISPFSTQHLYITNSTGNGLWYEGDETQASFRWVARLETEQGDIPVDFSVILYQEGTIEYFFSELESLEDEYKITGISNGNNQSFELSSITNVFAKTTLNKITYIPDNFAHAYSIDNDGTFHFNSAFANTINNITIRVTDYFEISEAKQFQLSDGLIFNYQITAGDNEIVEYGDTVKISLEITNISTNLIENIIANASINSSFITFISDQVNAGSLNAGESVILTDGISFTVHSNVPDNHDLLCELDLNSDSGNWSGNFGMQVFSPILQMSGPSIVDNGNGRLDPGETADLVLYINNSGHANAFDVLGELLIDDPYITINSSNQMEFGEVEAGGVSAQSISVSASEDAPPGHLAHFEMNYSAWPDFELNYEFDLLIGRFPVFIIDLDPASFSGPEIQSAIDELEILNDYDVVFPPDLDIYDNLFISLGRKWSKYTLSEYEGQLLSDFLNGGGNIYMEGGETWNEDPQTPVHSMFNFDISTTNLHACYSIQGEQGSFAEGMLFNYDSPIILFNHLLVPNGEAFSFLINPDNQYCYAVGYDADNYKTIGTNFDFGGLVDDEPPSTKKYLMAEILEFFGINVTVISTNEINSNNVTTRLVCTPNPIINRAIFSFNLTENEKVTLQISDIHGNLIKTVLNQREYSSGEHIIEMQSNFKPGMYVARLITKKGVYSSKFVVSN